MRHGVVIVGAGHAGVQLAASLRQEDYRGPVVLVDREPDQPYHKPPLSKAFLKGDAQNPQLLRGETFYERNGIDLVQGAEVVAVDPEHRSAHLADGTRHQFDKLVLAIGAKPRMPQIAGVDVPNVVALRSLADARRLHGLIGPAADVVVIGGGFIGLELAATLAALGKRVTILEATGRLLGRAVSAQVSHYVQSHLEAIGVRIMLDSAAAYVGGREGRAVSVATTAGGELGADLVIVGIGVEPDCRLAVAAGLACDNGILVDGAMRTSHPNIFAIGDCARFRHWLAGQDVRLESVQNATDQAKLAARAIVGHHETYLAVPWFWSDIGDIKLQMVGLALDADRQVAAGSLEDGAFSVYHFSDGRLMAIDSVNRPADHMLGRRMLAAGFSPLPVDVQAGGLAEAFARFQSIRARSGVSERAPAEDATT
jgi:3-phenylpropionate/trans-cinnamate dioxygenase ferredoxin reductase subunit